MTDRPTLDSLLSGLEERRNRFVVYTDDHDASSVDGWFANHNVDVEHRPLPVNAPKPFLVVERDGEFAGVLSLETVEELLEPPIDRPESYEGVSAAHRGLFEVLDEAVYTSLSREELLAVSREIEDRSYRVGGGTLHASFQRLSTFRPQVDHYRRLADRGLTIHVYGVDDWEPPEIPGVTYHPRREGPRSRYWVLAFDGGDEPSQSCGLLAREEENGFTGFWTDEPGLVADIRRALEFSGARSERR